MVSRLMDRIGIGNSGDGQVYSDPPFSIPRPPTQIHDIDWHYRQWVEAAQQDGWQTCAGSNSGTRVELCQHPLHAGTNRQHLRLTVYFGPGSHGKQQGTAPYILIQDPLLDRQVEVFLMPNQRYDIEQINVATHGWFA